MATKKKVDDVTLEKQATTKEDVDEQDSATRLWQSLSQTYGAKERDIQENYENERSQLNRQAQARGLGRSSYLLQMNQKSLENEGRDKDKNNADKIADYQRLMTEKEAKDAENERFERQLAEQTRQFNENLAFQREQNELARAFQTSEREAQQGYNTSERVATQTYNTSERLGQQAYQSGENALNRAFQTGEREAQQAYNTGERLGQQAFQSSENALNRAFQTGEREAQQRYNTSERVATQTYNTSERLGQQAYQSGENALNRAQSQSQFETQYNEGVRQFDLNLAYQRERNQVADQQWRTQLEEQIRQFNESSASSKDQFAQQLAEQIREFNILHPNNPVSTGGGGGKGSGNGNNNKGGDTNNVSKELQDVMASLGYAVNPNVTQRSNNGNVISGPTNQIIGKTAGAALSPTNYHIYNPSDYTDMGLDRSLPKRK